MVLKLFIRISNLCVNTCIHRPFCSQCSQGSSKCIYPESGKRYDLSNQPSESSTPNHENRGLPLGYLNQLEQRLADTEAALYGALITLRSMSPTAVAQASPKPELLDKSKAARMDEWSQLPMRHWHDMYHWQSSMGDQFVIQQQVMAPTETSGFGYSVSSPATESPSAHREEIQAPGPGSAIYAWQSNEDSHVQVGSPYDMHFQPAGVVSSPVYHNHNLKDPTPGSTVTTPDRLPEFGNSMVTSERTENEQSTRAEELSKSNPSIYF